MSKLLMSAKPVIKAVIFDFDGVILESTEIKTEAFLELFKETPEHRQAILEYHLEHQGITRYKKFRWICENLLGKEYNKEMGIKLGEAFSELVFEKIMKSSFVPGAPELLKALSTNRIPAFIASGTPDRELRAILRGRSLDHYFDRAYGSDLSKEEIIQKIKLEKNFNSSDLLFVGDAVSDYKAASAQRLHFVARNTPPMETFWIEKNIDPVDHLLEILDRYALS